MMNLLLLAAMALIPWIELRGAIPVGLAMGYHPLPVLVVTVVANILVIVPTFVVLDLVYARWLVHRPAVGRWVDHLRARGAPYVERYGVLGLALWVAVPLPGPGVYSGSILAWVFALDRRRAMLSIAAGVLTAGVLVTLAASGIITLIKQVR